MGICFEEKNKKPIEVVVEENKSEIKNEIMSMDMKMKLLQKEIDDLMEKTNDTTNGNYSKKDMQVMENDLYNKITKLENLEKRREYLNNRLESIDNKQSDFKLGKIIDKTNKIDDNLDIGLEDIIAKGNEKQFEQKKKDEISKNLLDHGINIANGNATSFEKKKKIEMYRKKN